MHSLTPHIVCKDALGAIEFYKRAFGATDGGILLSKDGGTIAMRQAYAPLREFDVGSALGRSEQSHWHEAVAIDRSRTDEATAFRDGPGTQFQTHAQPSPSMDAPAMSRG